MAGMAEQLNGCVSVPSSSMSGSVQRAGERLGNALGDAVDASRALVTGMRHRARQARLRAQTIKNEKPLHVLAVLGGLALAAGIATRVWRISTHD